MNLNKNKSSARVFFQLAFQAMIFCIDFVPRKVENMSDCVPGKIENIFKLRPGKGYEN